MSPFVLLVSAGSLGIAGAFLSSLFHASSRRALALTALPAAALGLAFVFC
ncbi:MAG: hypothetical protein AAF533_23280 [Acidobacteriota bacterium]